MTLTLITGASGFLGSHLAKHLEALGQEVICQYFNATPQNAQSWKKCDLRDVEDTTDLLKNVDTVFHFAGEIWGKAETEVKIVSNLIAAAQQHSVKTLVYASTCAVYGMNNAESPTSETVRADPVTPYADGKLKAETLLRAFAETSNCSVKVMRYFNPYGVGQDKRMAVPRMIESALNNETISVFGDGEQQRDFIYINDLIDVTLLLSDLEVSYEVFNIGSGVGTSVNELAQYVLRLTQSSSTLVHQPVPQGREKLEVSKRIASIGKINQYITWSAKHSLAEGLEHLVRALKK